MLRGLLRGLLRGMLRGLLRGRGTPTGSSCASRAGTEMDSVWVPITYTLAVVVVSVLGVATLVQAWRERGRR